VDDLTADDFEPPSWTLNFIDPDLLDNLPAAQPLPRSQWTQQEQDKQAKEEWEKSPECKRQREDERRAAFSAEVDRQAAEENRREAERLAKIHPAMHGFQYNRIPSWLTKGNQKVFGIVIKSFEDRRGAAGIVRFLGILFWPREEGCQRGDVVSLGKEECGSFLVEPCDYGRLQTNYAKSFSIRKDLLLPVTADEVVDFWMPSDDAEREQMLAAWIKKHNESSDQKLDLSPEEIIVASAIPDDSDIYAIISEHEDKRLIGCILSPCKIDENGNISGNTDLEHDDSLSTTVSSSCCSLIRRSEAITYWISDKAERERLLANCRLRSSQPSSVPNS
jgi:hypothetical protein